jgi:hypothetical protein
MTTNENEALHFLYGRFDSSALFVKSSDFYVRLAA